MVAAGGTKRAEDSVGAAPGAFAGGDARGKKLAGVKPAPPLENFVRGWSVRGAGTPARVCSLAWGAGTPARE